MPRAAAPGPRRVTAVLGGVFLLVFVASGIAPESRSTWVLENLLVVVLAVVLVVGRRRGYHLSVCSSVLLFAFLCIHEVGAHYTYSLVPYDEAWQALTGRSLDAAFGWERNHYDRAVHFLYGLLLAYPVRETLRRALDVRGGWSYGLTLGSLMLTSMIYELIEWGAAMAFGREIGHEYVGAQGDVWDAHKDMALASLGAAVGLGAEGLASWFRARGRAEDDDLAGAS